MQTLPSSPCTGYQVPDRSRCLFLTPLRSLFAFREWTSTPSHGPSYLLSTLSQKLSKMLKAQPKVLWAVSSSSPYLSNRKLEAASDLSWLVPLEVNIILREGFTLLTTCPPCMTQLPLPHCTWKERGVSPQLTGYVPRSHRWWWQRKHVGMAW